MPGLGGLFKARPKVRRQWTHTGEPTGRAQGGGMDASLDLQLRGGINPNFRLPFVHFDPASDFDPFPFNPGKHGRFVYR
jgi:hypothetical protein